MKVTINCTLDLTKMVINTKVYTYQVYEYFRDHLYAGKILACWFQL